MKLFDFQSYKTKSGGNHSKQVELIIKTAIFRLKQECFSYKQGNSGLDMSCRMKRVVIAYSHISMAGISLEPWKFVLDIDSSSH